MILRSGLEIVVATHNRGKVREVEDALRSLPVKLRFLSEFPGVTPVDEVGQTYEDNAVLKALGYAKQTGLLSLADDSGLEVDLLGGRPGVRSARFGGKECSDSDRVQLLLQELSEYENEERSARFVCCLAVGGWLSRPRGGNEEPSLLAVTEARCEGTITSAPRGTNGFGFDPVFVPAGFKATFGELSSEVKSEISHRAQALRSFRLFLHDWLAQT